MKPRDEEMEAPLVAIPYVSGLIYIVRTFGEYVGVLESEWFLGLE